MGLEQTHGLKNCIRNEFTFYFDSILNKLKIATGQLNAELGMNQNVKPFSIAMIDATDKDTQKLKHMGQPNNSANNDDLDFTQFSHSAQLLYAVCILPNVIILVKCKGKDVKNHAIMRVVEIRHPRK